MANNERVFAMPFSSIYPLYIQKIERKGRTVEELDEVICWLTGYSVDELHITVKSGVSLEGFFDQAPNINPNASLIKGIICGYRVEEITDPLMQKIRWMDKLVDELAHGKTMETILRR